MRAGRGEADEAGQATAYQRSRQGQMMNTQYGSISQVEAWATEAAQARAMEPARRRLAAVKGGKGGGVVASQVRATRQAGRGAKNSCAMFRASVRLLGSGGGACACCMAARRVRATMACVAPGRGGEEERKETNGEA